MKKVNEPLSALEIRALQTFFDRAEETMAFHEATGFLTGIVSTPTTFMPSTWLPALLGEHTFETVDEAQRVYGLIMRLYNQINIELNDGVGAHPSESLDEDDLSLWCGGYLEVSRVDSACCGQASRGSPRTLRTVSKMELDRSRLLNLY